MDPYRRQVEQWLAGRETATVEGERLTWHPAGTERPFVLELPAYFAKVHAE